MEPKIGICYLCGEYKQLMRAHVISRSLFKQLFKDYKDVHFVAPADLTNKYKVQDAFYDDGILCKECDNTFSPYEAYYNRLIRGDLLKYNKIRLTNITATPEYAIDEYDGVDTHKLRVFFLVTLWRSSISDQPHFKVVDIGAEQAVLAAVLKNPIELDYELFPVILISLKDVDDFRADTTVSPRVSTFGNVPVIMYIVNGWVFIYCTEAGKYPFLFEHRIIPNETLKVIRINHDPGVFLLNQLTNDYAFTRGEIAELKDELERQKLK